MEKAKAGDLFAKTPTSSNRRAGSLGLPMQVPGGGSRSCPYVCSLEQPLMMSQGSKRRFTSPSPPGYRSALR
jgi:hypothetical protein